ncbi:hypothetical protein GIB67_031814 [Kingdonia uniflora]|uniref:Uncharacterized protein n=1 Tax=Kingdonia uniflora TaxID=39325 RepID=A0A7J7L4I2_9MAGN|nr:hypothetical protein GIB67_031814 [Kingdonia uniflora]
MLEDDIEWIQCLKEALIIKIGYHLRQLFCVILINCNLFSPEELWDKFFGNIYNDLKKQIQDIYKISKLAEDQVTDYGLYLSEKLFLE